MTRKLAPSRRQKPIALRDRDLDDVIDALDIAAAAETDCAEENRRDGRSPLSASELRTLDQRASRFERIAARLRLQRTRARGTTETGT